MKLFEIVIDNKNYSFINSIKHKGKDYIAYSDSDGNVYISELEITENSLNFKEATKEMIEEVRSLMDI